MKKLISWVLLLGKHDDSVPERAVARIYVGGMPEFASEIEQHHVMGNIELKWSVLTDE